MKFSTLAFFVATPTIGAERAAEMKTRILDALDAGTVGGPPRLITLAKGSSWSATAAACTNIQMSLCTQKIYCPNGEGEDMSSLFPSDLPAHAWVASGDEDNSWIHLGNGGHWMCKDHTAHHGKPGWGSASNHYNPGKALCCTPPVTVRVASLLRLFFPATAAAARRRPTRSLPPLTSLTRPLPLAAVPPCRIRRRHVPPLRRRGSA